MKLYFYKTILSVLHNATSIMLQDYPFFLPSLNVSIFRLKSDTAHLHAIWKVCIIYANIHL